MVPLLQMQNYLKKNMFFNIFTKFTNLNTKLINKMKKTIILTAIAFTTVLTTFGGNTLHTDVYKVDAKQSTLKWYGEKLTGKHNGTILFSSGELNNDHGSFSGTFEINMASIEDKDMEAGEWKTKLENHLKSEDFFDVVKYPTSKFIIKSVTPIKDKKDGEFTHNVKGTLTIKDKTNDISFDATIKIQDNKVSCVGSAIVDRSKYDVKYGSKSFFPAIGDKMIYDEFTLKFNIVFVK